MATTSRTITFYKKTKITARDTVKVLRMVKDVLAGSDGGEKNRMKAGCL